MTVIFGVVHSLMFDPFPYRDLPRTLGYFGDWSMDIRCSGVTHYSRRLRRPPRHAGWPAYRPPLRM